MKSKTYVCKKIKLYNYLTSKGFVPFRIAPDLFDCKRLVWLYDDCDDLQAAITEYYSKIK